MKKILFISMILFAGCSSQPTTPTPAQELPPVDEEVLPKAAPPPSVGEKVYRNAAPEAIEAAPSSKEVKPKAPGKSCNTPLGEIPDGGKATGYLNPTVPPGEICISDTITCKDGKWKGTAIHPTCKTQK